MPPRAFAAWIDREQGRQPALEFVAGYAIETSLSIDNLFVFLVLFQGFHISEKRQHTALLWGVGGAVMLRAMFIAAGVTLIDRFHWITWVFGLFLLYAAFRLVRGGSAHAAIPGWIRRLQPAKGSLLPVILAVEVTDLLFAVDSIPAVLAVSHDPFVVYTSNIAAILGLRSLYFALASLLDRFRYLHYGLGVCWPLSPQNAGGAVVRGFHHAVACDHRSHSRRLRHCIVDRWPPSFDTPSGSSDPSVH